MTKRPIGVLHIGLHRSVGRGPQERIHQAGTRQNPETCYCALLKKTDIKKTTKIITRIFNPLVPRVQKIKIRNLTLNRLLIIEFGKKLVYLNAHYSEGQGLMG